MYCILCNRYSGLKPLHPGCEKAWHDWQDWRLREEEDEQVAKIERLAEK